MAYELARTAEGVVVRGGGADGGDLPIRQIIGVGRNYAAHASERGAEAPTRPMLFCKNLASLALHEEGVVIPEACADTEQVDYEGELGVIVGRPIRDAPVETALEGVLGYCAANDVSARWWQKEGAGGQFFRGKSFDTFCPIGPRVIPGADVADPQSLRIVTRIGEEVMQDGSTGDMLFPVDMLLALMSRGMTLLPGTLILTGTPEGVGAARTPPRFLRHGDRVSVEIEGLGRLENPVRAQEA